MGEAAGKFDRFASVAQACPQSCFSIRAWFETKVKLMNPTPTLIGSIARALASSYGDPDWTNHVAAARAVLAAMREPTPEMLTAALPDLPYWGDLATDWTAMIDFVASEPAN